MGDGGKENELRQVVKNPNEPEKIQEENEPESNEENELRQTTETEFSEMDQEENELKQSAKENQPTQSTETNQEELMEKVAECLLFPLAELVKSPAQRQKSVKLREELSILVLCYVNSTLSAQVYDAGFVKITNAYATISSVTTADVFEECNMRGTAWRNMSFTGTEPEFTAEEFNAVVDDGLDAMLESEKGKIVAKRYLHEVKSILKGKYMCITSAGSHILDLLFTTFRFGWEMGLHTIAQDQEPDLHTFLVVAEKNDPNILYNISINLGASHDDQAGKVIAAVEKENKFRDSIIPGYIKKFMLVDRAIPEVSYKAILLDAKQDLGLDMNKYSVLILPDWRHIISSLVEVHTASWLDDIEQVIGTP